MTLRNRGIAIEEGKSDDSIIWSLDLNHPEWGEATLCCLRDFPMPPEILIDWDSDLTESEKTEVRACGTAVSVVVNSSRKHLLRDRKNALFFVDAVMGEEGVAAMDHCSEKFWSRRALKAEVVHNADVDVNSLFTAHLVTFDDEKQARWLHTHGLAKIGLFDFDILNPSDSALHPGVDAARAIAFAILEGTLKVGGSAHIFSKAGPMLAMSAKDFTARADKRWVELRDDSTGDHVVDRAILCEPPPSGFFGRFRSAAAPSKFLMGAFPDDCLIQYSTEASQVMAERARATYPFFRQAFEEVRPIKAMALVKIGYRVDGGGERDLEHLWFQVHEGRDAEVDATLLNQPFHIARMKEGDRGLHSIGGISDWQIMTPLGSITPRQTKALRAFHDLVADGKLEQLVQIASQLAEEG